jgi:hypothetical protein
MAPPDSSEPARKPDSLLSRLIKRVGRLARGLRPASDPPATPAPVPDEKAIAAAAELAEALSRMDEAEAMRVAATWSQPKRTLTKTNEQGGEIIEHTVAARRQKTVEDLAAHVEDNSAALLLSAELESMKKSPAPSASARPAVLPLPVPGEVAPERKWRRRAPLAEDVMNDAAP